MLPLHRPSVLMRVEGEQQASPADRFRVVFDACYPRVMAYATRRTASVDDAEDVVADTFAVVWRRLDDVPAGEAAVPWVYGVARRCLANHYRGRNRRRRLTERLAAETPRSDGGDDADYAGVHEALGRLRPDDREILTLAAWDGLGNAEIATVLGSSPSSVAVRAHRARRRLARELARMASVQSIGPIRTQGVVKGAETPRREEA